MLPPAGGHREVTYRPGGAPGCLPLPVAALAIWSWAVSASLRWLLRVR